MQILNSKNIFASVAVTTQLQNVFAIMDPGDLFVAPKLPVSQDGSPIQLDPELLKAGMSQGDILVYYHAPWCGHCVTLEPEYNKASQAIWTQGLNATFATYDAAMHGDYLKSNQDTFDIKGLPTIRWYTKHGDWFEYDGPRKADIIANWVKFMKVDPITDMVSIPTPDKFGNGDRIVVTLVAGQRTAAFERVALQYRTDAKFAFVEDTTFLGDARLIVQRPGEDSKEMYEIEDREAIQNFFLRERLPTFGEMTRESYGAYKAQGKIGLVYVLFKHEDDADLLRQVEMHKAVVKKLAKKWWGKFAFAYVNTLKQAETLKSWFNVATFPAICVTNLHSDGGDENKRFVLNGEFEPQRVNDFLVGVVDGTTRPNFKSEEVPENQDNQNIIKVVGKTLLSEVFRPDRDFFLEIYAPWCVHCHSLEKSIESVADSLGNVGANHLIRVGRLNGQANDSPSKQITWEHFPTVLFIPAGSDKVIVYEGDRTASDMLSFIAQHSSQKLLQKATCQILNKVCTNETCGPELCKAYPSSSVLMQRAQREMEKKQKVKVVLPDVAQKNNKPTVAVHSEL